jgi:hypothetical protein
MRFRDSVYSRLIIVGSCLSGLFLVWGKGTAPGVANATPVEVAPGHPVITEPRMSVMITVGGLVVLGWLAILIFQATEQV